MAITRNIIKEFMVSELLDAVKYNDGWNDPEIANIILDNPEKHLEPIVYSYTSEHLEICNNNEFETYEPTDFSKCENWQQCVQAEANNRLAWMHDDLLSEVAHAAREIMGK